MSSLPTIRVPSLWKQYYLLSDMSPIRPRQGWLGSGPVRPVRFSLQTLLPARIFSIFCHFAVALRDTLKGVRSYLVGRVDFEPNPYFKGRYQVALATVTNAWNNLSHPYEVAEILFNGSRFQQKVERWLAQRCERFPYLKVNFDGSLGDWLEPQSVASSAAVAVASSASDSSLPPKKPVCAEIPGSGAIRHPEQRKAKGVR